MASVFRLALSLAVLVAACGDASDPAAGSGGTGGGDGGGGSGGSPEVTPSLPWPLTAFPSLPDSVKNVPQARIDLGNLLFYDTILSTDRETACATCHSEFWGMSDALPVAVGHGAGPLAGPGREGPNTLRRNSPALFNMAFRETFNWDGGAATILTDTSITFQAQEECLIVKPLSAISSGGWIPETGFIT